MWARCSLGEWRWIFRTPGVGGKCERQIWATTGSSLICAFETIGASIKLTTSDSTIRTKNSSRWFSLLAKNAQLHSTRYFFKMEIFLFKRNLSVFQYHINICCHLMRLTWLKSGAYYINVFFLHSIIWFPNDQYFEVVSTYKIILTFSISSRIFMGIISYWKLKSFLSRSKCKQLVEHLEDYNFYSLTFSAIQSSWIIVWK